MNAPSITSIAPTVVDAAESIGETISDTVTDGAATIERTVRQRSRVSLLAVILAIVGVVGIVTFLRSRSGEDDRAEPGATASAA